MWIFGEVLKKRHQTTVRLRVKAHLELLSLAFENNCVKVNRCISIYIVYVVFYVVVYVNRLDYLIITINSTFDLI